MSQKEIYKGIEFVRISNLPKEQSEKIYAAFPKEKIIKILRDEVILRDCIQYHEYQEWFKETYQRQRDVMMTQPETTFSNYNLVLK
jgi:alpha-ketoglutarate-dependent taurine dioxygenase